MEVQEILPELKAFRDSAEGQLSALKGKQGEFNERLHDLEQHSVAARNLGEPYHSADSVNLQGILADENFRSFAEKRSRTTPAYSLGLSLKALVNAGNGDLSTNDSAFPTFATRDPQLRGYVLKPLRLAQLLPYRPVDANSFQYNRIIVTGDADYQLEEGDEKAEVEVGGELVTSNIATIAVHTTLSMQVLDDAQGLSQDLQMILSNKVQAKLDDALITGSGTGNRIEGLYTQSVVIVTHEQAIADRIGEAIYVMEDQGYTPNVILMNPADWFALSILKDNDGNYIYGNPASPAQPMLWNRPVVTSSSVPAGTALVGDTSQTAVLDRMPPTIYFSADHKDYRTRNLILVLVELRAGLALYDTGAFRRISLEPISG